MFVGDMKLVSEERREDLVSADLVLKCPPVAADIRTSRGDSGEQMMSPSGEHTTCWGQERTFTSRAQEVFDYSQYNLHNQFCWLFDDGWSSFKDSAGKTADEGDVHMVVII